ncbi:MAG: uL15m family ribosomal protein [Patescibacteria group bacterium]
MNLVKIVNRPAKRVGRGIGSGKGGHTSTRGSKGQKARGKVKIGFEGTKFKKSLIKRLPKLRGRGKFKPWGTDVVALDITRFATWPAKLVVTNEKLRELGWISQKSEGKIVGNKKIENVLNVKIATSANVAKIVEDSGGTIETA